jgi:hypothetical protein
VPDAAGPLAAATVTVRGVLVVLAIVALFLLVDVLVALAVYRDASHRPDRAPLLDAAVAFAFPVGGWLIYLRHRAAPGTGAPSAQGRRAAKAAARAAGRSASSDLVPRLTEELRLAHADAEHWRAVAAHLQSELDRRPPT